MTEIVQSTIVVEFCILIKNEIETKTMEQKKKEKLRNNVISALHM